MSGLPPALRLRDFRLYFVGQLVSVAGTWMHTVALSWLVAEQTGSGLAVGMMVGAQLVPTLVLGPLAGLAADRFSRRRLLIGTQIVAGLPALGLFVLAQRGEVPYAAGLVAGVALGVVSAFDVPARQALVVEIVGREHLASAKALTSTAYNLAAVLGPPLAGLLIAQVGVAICFLGDAVSYGAAVASLLLIRRGAVVGPSTVASPVRTTVGGGLRAGLDYARSNTVVGASLLGLVAYSLLAMQPPTLLPFFADEVLGIGPAGFGLLTAAEGAGAVIGTVVLAVYGARLGTANVVLGSVAVAVAALVGVSLSRTPALSMILLAMAGFAMVWTLVILATRIQAHTPDALQGRVMALYAQASPNGSGPLGSIAIGGLASAFGAPVAMAVAALAAGIAFLGLRLAFPAAFAAEPSVDSPTPVAERQGAPVRS
jgi:MFS family permease